MNTMFLAVLVAFPIFIWCSWCFGFLIVWLCSLLSLIFFGEYQVKQARLRFYAKFQQKETQIPTAYTGVCIQNIQHTHSVNSNQNSSKKCEWLNKLLSEMWDMNLKDQIQAMIKENHSIDMSLFGFFGKVKIEQIYFEGQPPIIESIQAETLTPNNTIQLDVKFRFFPQCTYTILIEAFSASRQFRLKGSNFTLKGNAQLSLQLSPYNISHSIVAMCFKDTPEVDFNINSRVGDLMSLPGFYHAGQRIFRTVSEKAKYPNRVHFTVSGQSVPLPTGPIVEVGVILSNETLPQGWEVIRRTISGTSANINRGAKSSKDVFICFRRQLEGDIAVPITGICVIFPDRSEFPPDSFMVISRTIRGRDANLTQGDGTRVYLCYSTRPGNPIYSLAVCNQTVEFSVSNKYTPIRFTPFGRKANLNKSQRSTDKVFLLYQGGTRSLFGFPISPPSPKLSEMYSGMVVVRLHVGKNLKAIDVGGVCDASAQIFLSSGSVANSKVKHTRVVKKNSNPKWNKIVAFSNTSVFDTLNVLVVDNSPGHIMEDDQLIGALKIPFDILETGKEFKAWYKLQLSPQGEVLVSITPYYFGLKHSCWDPSVPLMQLDVNCIQKPVRIFPNDRLSMNVEKISATTDARVVRSMRFSQPAVFPEKESPDLRNTSVPESIFEEHSQNLIDLTIEFVEKRGNLMVSSDTKKSKYSKRWVVLSKGTLEIYRTSKDKSAYRRMDLKNAEVSRDDTKITLKAVSCRIDIRADTVESSDDWLNALKTNICLISQFY